MSPEEARAQYSVFRRFAYLNAGSEGPLADATAEAVARERRRDVEDGRGSLAYVERVIEARARARAALAREIGVPEGNVALTRATTDGCNIVLLGLGLGPDDEVVTTDAEHFGLLGALGASGARVRVVEVSGRPAEDALDLLLAAVRPRTRLIALSQVLWTTGRVLPVRELAAATDVPLLVDGAQSAGAIEVDATPFHFFTVSCHKWLCCPDSTGLLHVRDPDLLAVKLPSYFSQQSYERDGSFAPRPGAARFDTGWLAPGLLAGVEAALAVHPEWRFARAAEMAARCRERLAERFDVVTEPGQATLVAFRPTSDPTELVARAFEAGVIVREIPGRGLIRVSCGYWTNDDDIDRLLAVIS